MPTAIRGGDVDGQCLRQQTVVSVRDERISDVRGCYEVVYRGPSTYCHMDEYLTKTCLEPEALTGYGGNDFGIRVYLDLRLRTEKTSATLHTHVVVQETALET